jgi:hypothetical protein
VSDNCRLDANAGQKDTDHDGVGNTCDADDEADGVADKVDNCRKKANTDGDHTGDACDPDDDGDGAKDCADNCPLVKNPDQADSDGDSVGDACDTSSAPSWQLPRSSTNAASREL